MKLLASFVLICCTAAAANAANAEFTKKVKEELKSTMETCAKEVNASPADVASLLAHSMPSSHEGKCILKCMQHHYYGEKNADGSLNTEAAVASLEPLKEADATAHGIIVDSVRTCGGSVAVDADACVYAANMGHCFFTTAVAKGLDKDLVL